VEPDRDTLLGLERMRLTWDYAAKELDLHKQRMLQLFTAFVTLALTGLASVALDRVPAQPGFLFAGRSSAPRTRNSDWPASGGGSESRTSRLWVPSTA
jgi:hypothetical protein